MVELSRARAELALLEEQARRLLNEFLRVRAAVAMQRAKVDELIRTRPTAFNLLPTEILLSILDLDVRACRHLERKYQLAGVCRRWKDVIFDRPSFWTTIHVATSPSSIMTHVERSRGALIDIVIETSLWSQSKHLALVPSLDIVSSLAHRWHRLSIAYLFGFNEGEDESDDTTLAEFIIGRINHLHFPSLKYVAISYCNAASLNLLSPTRTPILEHLELKEFIAKRTDFPLSIALKTLKLDFYRSPVDYPLFPYLIPTQALTKLSLSRSTETFSPQPNSIHIPSLKVLEISCLAKTRRFMNAIVAPNVEQFTYTSFDADDPPSVVFRGLRSKFTNVRHLSFYRPKTKSTPELLYADAIALCEAFPGVHHVELNTDQLSHFFDPTLSNARARRPIDLWTELESLTLCGLHPKWLEPNQFSAWLVDRQALGLRKLYVKLVHSSEYDGPSESFDFEFPPLYEILKENCILEFDNVAGGASLYASEFSVESGKHIIPVCRAIFTVYGLAFAAANHRTYG